MLFIVFTFLSQKGAMDLASVVSASAKRPRSSTRNEQNRKSKKRSRAQAHLDVMKEKKKLCKQFYPLSCLSLSVVQRTYTQNRKN